MISCLHRDDSSTRSDTVASLPDAEVDYAVKMYVDSDVTSADERGDGAASVTAPLWSQAGGSGSHSGNSALQGPRGSVVVNATMPGTVTSTIGACATFAACSLAVTRVHGEL